MMKMKFTKKSIYIGLFSILYLIVAFSSFFHACSFFGLANNSWMSIILAFAFEVGQAAVLFSLLTSVKDRSRIMPWVLMTMFTLVQVIGNVYSSYKYIITNSVENLRYFKEPIFIWTSLPDDQATVIVTYVVGAILPVAALLLTSMITNYLTDQAEEEKNEPILVPQVTSEKGPENPPIELKDREDFLKVCEDNDKQDDHSGDEGLSEKQEIENLNVALDKKDEEIEKLKQQLREQEQDPEKVMSPEDEDPEKVMAPEYEDPEKVMAPEDEEPVDEELVDKELEKVNELVDEESEKELEQESELETESEEKSHRASRFVNL